jgi:hypothetical protein
MAMGLDDMGKEMAEVAESFTSHAMRRKHCGFFTDIAIKYFKILTRASLTWVLRCNLHTVDLGNILLLSSDLKPSISFPSDSQKISHGHGLEWPLSVYDMSHMTVATSWITTAILHLA